MKRTHRGREYVTSAPASAKQAPGPPPTPGPVDKVLDQAQIVHLKPDDVLVFSNIGLIDDETLQEFAKPLKEALGGRMVVFFPEHVDIAVLRELEAKADE